MGQLVRLYAAPNTFLAGAVEEALRAADIACVQLTNEMPMQPGFNWGAGNYADILVDSADENRAREVLDDVQQLLCKEDEDCQRVFPAVINLRSNAWLLPALICGWGLLFGMQLGVSGYGASGLIYRELRTWSAATRDYYSLFAAHAVFATVILSLLIANWRTTKRIARHVSIALLELLVLPFWLAVELGLALLRLPRFLAASLRSDW